MISLSVAVPVYNERFTIEKIIQKVINAKPLDKEIIVVDDYSTDGTRDILKRLHKIHEFKLILNHKNSGKGACLIKALSQAKGAIFVPQDADLEVDPADYMKLMGPILENSADVVFGSRLTFIKKQDYIMRTLLINKLFAGLVNFLYRGRFTDIMTCYKMCRTEVIKGLQLKSERFNIEPEIACKVLKRRCRIAEVPISYYPRRWKEGKKIKWSDTFAILNAIIKYRFIG